MKNSMGPVSLDFVLMTEPMKGFEQAMYMDGADNQI